MFGKKVLGLISLLFLGSQLSSVKATGIESCTDAGVTIGGGCTPVDETPTGVCIDGNKIYTYGSTKATCYVSVDDSTLTEGIHVLTVSGTTVNDVTLSSVGDTANTNYLLYVCDSSNCDITNGFVKGEDDAYIKIISGDTAGVDVSTSLEDSDKANCTPGTIFKDKDDSSAIKFCISAGNGVALASRAEDTKNYIVAKSEPLTADSDSSKTDMVVQVSDNAFVLNTIYTDNEYCVYGTNEVQSRIENFCSGTILENLYSCEKGLCSIEDYPVGVGKYIVEKKGEFKLYSCTEDTKSSTLTCEVDDNVSDNGILVVKEESNDKEYTFQKVIPSSDLSTSNVETDSLFIYDCVGGTCKPTEALIRYNTVPATAYCASGTKCAAGTETITLTNIGAISYSSNFIMTPTGASAINIASGGNYAFAGTNNAFAVIKNVGDVIVAKAQILDTTVYVKTLDNTIATSEDYQSCASEIKQYTSVNSLTATAGSECVAVYECELDTETAGNNVHCTEGYYLKSTAAGSNVGKLVKTDEETGTLYHCDGASDSCVIVSDGFKPGFYKNVDNISNGNVQYLKCPSISTCVAVKVTETACSEAKVGGLIVDSQNTNKFSICIDNDSNAIELAAGSASTKVFISIDTTADAGADAFGTKKLNSFVLLDFISDNGGVRCVKNDSDTFTYRYTGPDQKLVKRTDTEKSTICGTKDTMKEFKKGEDSIYTKS